MAETEKLRSALLTSISHDLRTPLASIIGSISSLRSYGTLYDEDTRDELLATAQDEAERLNRYVANLLDMTQLDAGATGTQAPALRHRRFGRCRPATHTETVGFAHRENYRFRPRSRC